MDNSVFVVDVFQKSYLKICRKYSKSTKTRRKENNHGLSRIKGFKFKGTVVTISSDRPFHLYKGFQIRMSTLLTYRVFHETWQLANSFECLLPYTVLIYRLFAVYFVWLFWFKIIFTIIWLPYNMFCYSLWYQTAKQIMYMHHEWVISQKMSNTLYQNTNYRKVKIFYVS